jgi:hypothetical protein
VIGSRDSSGVAQKHMTRGNDGVGGQSSQSSSREAGDALLLAEVLASFFGQGVFANAAG